MTSFKTAGEIIAISAGLAFLWEFMNKNKVKGKILKKINEYKKDKKSEEYSNHSAKFSRLVGIETYDPNHNEPDLF
jgi:hypothetical protein